MAAKVAVKIGSSSQGPTIVLKHPELLWKLSCINQEQGRVQLVSSRHATLDIRADEPVDVTDGFELPRDIRSLRLVTDNVPDTFSAYLTGVAEDAVSSV